MVLALSLIISFKWDAQKEMMIHNAWGHSYYNSLFNTDIMVKKSCHFIKYEDSPPVLIVGIVG